MAGEWIKVEHHIHEKTEVAMIADHTGLDTDQVIGKLIKVWAWASRNCRADGVTNVTALRIIREMTTCANFDEAMINCGWICAKGDKISFANFDRHNSQSAKDRALGAIRKAKQRSHENVPNLSRLQRDKNGTKRREDISSAKALPSLPTSC